MKKQINEANKEALKRITEARPYLVDVQPAINVIPGMGKKLILHSGPPITYRRMCGPQKGGTWGALLYEGLASNLSEAKKIASSGEITFEPTHDHKTVGPMAGITSASMPVYVVENRNKNKNKKHGNTNYISMSPFIFGNGYLKEGQKLAKWVRNTYAPVIREVIKLAGGIDLKTILAKGLYMGDEEHNRFDACNALYAQVVMPHLVQTDFPKKDLIQVAEHFRDNIWHFGLLMMAACKNMMEPAMGIKHSTLVTLMARNGVEAGIKVSGLGDRWFTGPAQLFQTAVFFPPYKAGDANPDIGDSAISETRGLGGAAFAGSLPATLSVGGSAEDALKQTRDYYQITAGKDNIFRIPALDFEGVPLGIDIRKVVESGFTPSINTGIAHRDPGYSRIGSGRSNIPMDCFTKALKAFGKEYGL